jgi:hypothetical protein
MQEASHKERSARSLTEPPKKKKAKKKELPSSFFDYDDEESKELKMLWTKIRSNHTTELKIKPKLEGSFEKKGKRMGIWKSRYYLLTESFLVYQDVRI